MKWDNKAYEPLVEKKETSTKSGKKKVKVGKKSGGDASSSGRTATVTSNGNVTVEGVTITGSSSSSNSPSKVSSGHGSDATDSEYSAHGPSTTYSSTGTTSVVVMDMETVYEEPVSGSEIELVDAPGSSSSPINLNSFVFGGISVEQKFISTTQFERKFVWVNYETKTFHMSLYESKERRHKEASLCDIVAIDKKKPTKLKGPEAEANADVYANVQFYKGGGIDLKFASSEQRDEFYFVLNAVVALAKR